MQITGNTSGAYHVQYVVCHVVRKDNSALNFDRVGITFILPLFHWPKSVTDEGGEETGVPREKPRRRNSEKATYYSTKIQAQNEAPTRTQVLAENRHSNHYTTRRPTTTITTSARTTATTTTTNTIITINTITMLLPLTIIITSSITAVMMIMTIMIMMIIMSIIMITTITTLLSSSLSSSSLPSPVILSYYCCYHY